MTPIENRVRLMLHYVKDTYDAYDSVWAWAHTLSYASYLGGSRCTIMRNNITQCNTRITHNKTKQAILNIVDLYLFTVEQKYNQQLRLIVKVAEIFLIYYSR